MKKIVIRDFRNISLQELEFSPNVNCISGGNGEGKTNLLDSVWYLSMTKSAFSTTDRFNFRHGCDSFAISGIYGMPGGTDIRISVQVDSEGEKKLKRDDKPYQKISEHIGLIPIVMVSPADSSMVCDSGEERRRFVNSVLSQMDRNYLNSLQQYNRFLQQRNRLLKDGSPDPDLLGIIDEKMAALSRPVCEARRRFVEDLNPVVKQYYSAISGGGENVGISYESDLKDADFRDVAASRLQRDLILKYTSAGVHRDDFLFSMDGHPIRKCGSQGQQKSFLVALKFAQYDIMKEAYGYPPILLLDDLFDKLDPVRVGNLLKMVSGSEFGQIFITDSNKVRIRSLVDEITSDRKYYEAEGGAFSGNE